MSLTGPRTDCSKPTDMGSNRHFTLALVCIMVTVCLKNKAYSIRYEGEFTACMMFGAFIFRCELTGLRRIAKYLCVITNSKKLLGGRNFYLFG